jgi:hypothetical protein
MLTMTMFMKHRLKSEQVCKKICELLTLLIRLLICTDTDHTIDSTGLYLSGNS